MPLGYIYKLESSFEDPCIYVGSTVNLTKRKYKHKSNCNNPNSNKYNFKVYQYIRDYGGFNNWFMLTLEEFEYETKEQLREREQHWIKELKADLNGRDSIKDKEYCKKYREENKKQINEKNKQYYKKNKEKFKNYYKERNEKFDCECGGRYVYQDKAKHLKTKKHQSYLSSKII